MTKSNQQRSFGIRLLVVSATLVLVAVAAAAMLVSRSVGAAPQSAPTVKLRTLYQFQGASGGDGAEPFAGVIVDAEGNLYGTTEYGGTATSCDTEFLAGCGTMFKLDPTGKETFVFSFDGTDGFNPQGSLIQDASGNLYGTTAYGGGNGRPNGFGNVFKIDKKGQETVIYAFTGQPDGFTPFAGVIFDADGNLYGTTSDGGANCGLCGAVFKLDTAGQETVLYSFTGDGDGRYPTSRLIRDAQGSLYGTTYAGAGAGECGAVFKLDTAGNLTVLHTFAGNPDGCQPPRGVIPDATGNLYGTTEVGGQECDGFPIGCGIVYKLDRAGKESVLHTFSGKPDGRFPYAPPTLEVDGNLYGTTKCGGEGVCNDEAGCGIVYKIDKDGIESILYTFTGGADGGLPYGWLAPDGKGHLIGTTSVGGDSNCNPSGTPPGCGTVFEITP